MKYEVAAIDLQDLVVGAVLVLLDLVVDREYGDFFNGLLDGVGVKRAYESHLSETRLRANP